MRRKLRMWKKWIKASKSSTRNIERLLTLRFSACEKFKLSFCKLLSELFCSNEFFNSFMIYFC